MARITNYTFTLHNYSELDVAQLQAYDCKYIIFGRELTAKEGPHLQGYISLNKEKTLSALKKSIGISTIHLKPAEKDSLVNKNYCSKGKQSKEEWNDLKTKGPNYGLDADIIEVGNRPLTKKEVSTLGGDATKDIWDAAFASAKSGNLGKYSYSFCLNFVPPPNSKYTTLYR